MGDVREALAEALDERDFRGVSTVRDKAAALIRLLDQRGYVIAARTPGEPGLREVEMVRLLRAARRGDWGQLPGSVWNEIDAALTAPSIVPGLDEARREVEGLPGYNYGIASKGQGLYRDEPGFGQYVPRAAVLEILARHVMTDRLAEARREVEGLHDWRPPADTWAFEHGHCAFKGCSQKPEAHTSRTTVLAIIDSLAPTGLDVRRVVKAIHNVAKRHNVVKDPPPDQSLLRIYGYSTTIPDSDAEIAFEYARLTAESGEPG